MGWWAPERGAVSDGAVDGAVDDDPGYTQPLPPMRGSRRGPGRRPGRRPGRGRRILKRLVLTVTVLVIVAAIGVAALWVATPPASEATQIAQQEAQARGIAYPGPPIPATFSNALIATEDKRFHSEIGVDPFAVARLISSLITGDTSDQGGATLEQQLAKMLYTPGRSGVLPELKQVVLAFKLNFAYSKPEILRMYAEVAYYGHYYYGLQAASCGYFGHPAADLTPVQGAMLAGAVNAPTLDDPINNPVQAKARLDHVIGRMLAVGDITQAQAQQMMNTSLGIVPRDQAHC
jgi:penicillin-binding protein 1A